MVIDWTNPQEVSELFERVGREEFNRLQQDHHKRVLIENAVQRLGLMLPAHAILPRKLPESAWRFVRHAGGGKIVDESGTIARVQTHGMRIGAGPVLAGAETMQRYLYRLLEIGPDIDALTAFAREVEAFLDTMEKEQ